MSASSLSPMTIDAVLDLDPTEALPAFEQEARRIGFPVTPTPQLLTVHLIGGDLVVEPLGEALRITIIAPEEAMLQMLRDYVTEQLARHDLTPVWRGHRPQAQPDSHARTRLVASERLSPSYRRVTVAGRDLRRYTQEVTHFRLLFGPKELGWPATDANGVTQWPGGAAAWHRPVYTTRALRHGPDETELEFDVFLHDGGRTAHWAETASPGEEIVLVGPAASRGASQASWQAMIGDETAVPVIARFLATLPAHIGGEVMLIVPTAEDIQPLQHPSGVKLRWLLRSDGATPVKALETLQIPTSDRYVFFAASARETDAARAICTGLGLAKSEYTSIAYWGKSR